jgi:hypothetical protein
MTTPHTHNSRRRQAQHVLLAVLLASLLAPALSMAQTAEDSSDPPVLAYYYIWFNTESWNRAKIDIPLLGMYSSDDEEIMRLHVQWAKASGIDGFIVSWKNTEVLSKRLAQLVEISREEHFKLTIIYEGLNFYRNPLPPDQISADFAYFIKTYGQDPVFDLFDKPVMIWSGTWKFNRTQIERVTTLYREHLLILASEKQPEAYEDIADLVDGNAYYWSSVDPATFPDYAGKLERMSKTIHEHGGLWIAPAAPGFDARHMGGKRAVLRHDGATLQTQFNTAMGSSPDAIGIISWNEFSESSNIEPSCLYGDRYLNVTAGLLGGMGTSVDIPCNKVALATAQAGAVTTPVAQVGAVTSSPVAEATPIANIVPRTTFDWDSSAPQGTVDPGDRIGTITLLGLIAGLMGFSVIQVTRRALREESVSNTALRNTTFPVRKHRH